MPSRELVLNYPILVTLPYGLESLAQEEIIRLANQLGLVLVLKLQEGRIQIDSGENCTESELKSFGLLLCQYSRFANRILWHIDNVNASSSDALYDEVTSITWPEHMAADSRLLVQVNGTNDELTNTQFIAQRIKDAIVDRFLQLDMGRPSVDKVAPQFILYAKLIRNRASIYIDLAGGSLHRRGYRLAQGEAPLKENVAAAVVIRSGYDAEHGFYDPMCGAGTLAIEAAAMLAGLPLTDSLPAAITHWKGISSVEQDTFTGWKRQLEQNTECIDPVSNITIYASDNDPKMVATAQQNAEAAKVAHLIHFFVADVTQFALPHGLDPANTMIVSNPPYGERLADVEHVKQLFTQFAGRLKQQAVGARLCLISSTPDTLSALKLRRQKSYKVFNGKLECQIAIYPLSGENLVEFKPNLDSEFANRLKKNVRNLKRFEKQHRTNAYRLYDADLPNYNVAIDRYNDHYVVQEYAAPKQIEPHVAKKRLNEVLTCLPSILDVSEEHIHVKTRQRQSGKSQYQRQTEYWQLDNSTVKTTVFEDDARFEINLTDYLDVGLFLDHRETRRLVRAASDGKRVLNVFSYTASVGVHAALGGAIQVTNVDLSKNYLDWARRNFLANKLSAPHQFIQADGLTFLRETEQTFDVIFIDPPTFSNSKKLDHDFDVQRDHLELLELAKRCLRSGGMIIFSNNYRGFTLAPECYDTSIWQLDNLTSVTIPEDFKRNPKIHQCFRLRPVTGS